MSSMHTAFSGFHVIARGPATEVAPAARDAGAGQRGDVLVFDDATGALVDIDPRGDAAPAPPEPRGRGRPRLGVVAREVTLLPRHWDWLSAQPGGASVALRRLVDEARRASGDVATARVARERCYRFLSALGGDLPDFEEASRALFAGDADGFAARAASWPEDVRAYALALAEGAWTAR